MSAARRAPAKKSAKKKADPGTVCRELVAAAQRGELPRGLLLLGPTRGEDEPWFGEQVISAARHWAREQDDLDLLDVDGGSPDFDPSVLDSFLAAPGLFGGARVLFFSRAAKPLKRWKRLAQTLADAAAAPDGPVLMVVEAPGSGMTAVVKPLSGVESVRVERFRRLYADPPPWRPHDFDASEAAQFVQAEGATRGLRFGPGAAGALVQLTGGRPADLVQGVEHFALLGLERVDEEQVREVAAASAEGSAFDFADALLDGDGRRAYRCLSALRRRGLRAWDGKRIAPRDAFSMMVSVAAKQRLQTAAVRQAMDQGVEFAAACKAAGVAAGGPPAQRMQNRLKTCDGIHLATVLKALHEAELNVKRAGWGDPVRALEALALRCHRVPSRG
jgi:DNA polymerase III delta subunit